MIQRSSKYTDRIMKAILPLKKTAVNIKTQSMDKPFDVKTGIKGIKCALMIFNHRIQRYRGKYLDVHGKCAYHP